MPSPRDDITQTDPQASSPKPSSRINRLIVKLADNVPLVLAIYAVSLALATWLYSLIEHLGLSDSFEWAYQTALTIGYGDFPPHTLLGRLLTAFFGHLWIWGIVPLIIANIIVRVQHDKDEYTHKEQEWVALVLMLICAALKITPPPSPSDTNLGNLDIDEELA